MSRWDLQLKTVHPGGIQIEVCPGGDGERLAPGELKPIIDVGSVRFSDERRPPIDASFPVRPADVADAGHGCPVFNAEI